MADHKPINTSSISSKNSTNSPLQQYVQNVHERMDKFSTPSFRILKEMQERLELLSSPTIKASLELSNKMNFLSHLTSITTNRDLQHKYKEIFINKPYIGNLQVHHNFISLYHQISIEPIFKASAYSSPIFELLKKFDLSDYSFDLEDSNDLEIEEYQLDIIKDAEPEKKIILLHEANRLKTAIQDIYRDNSLLYKIHDRAFEEIVAELLRSQQFDVELTKQTRDGGYDILAIKNLAGFPLRFLVECKRYAKTRHVGVDIIRSFSNVIQNEDANKGIICTTSYFSRDAKQHGQKYMPYKLDFRDNNHIMEWIRTYLNPVTLL